MPPIQGRDITRAISSKNPIVNQWKCAADLPSVEDTKCYTEYKNLMTCIETNKFSVWPCSQFYQELKICITNNMN